MVKQQKNALVKIRLVRQFLLPVQPCVQLWEAPQGVSQQDLLLIFLGNGGQQDPSLLEGDSIAVRTEEDAVSANLLHRVFQRVVRDAGTAGGVGIDIPVLRCGHGLQGQSAAFEVCE